LSGRIRVAAIALCALAAACDSAFEPIPPEESHVLVHAVLDLGSPTQFVLLEHSLTNEPPASTLRANITLETPTGTATARLDEDCCPSVYELGPVELPSGLLPGATYTLRLVMLGSGDTITGTTTVPSAFPASNPTTVGTFNRLTDTLRLSWERVPGARSYQVSVMWDETRQGFPQVFTHSVFADTSIALPGTAREQSFDGEFLFPPGERVRVVVAAVDDNYYTYFHAQADPFAGSPPSRLTGGLGVFGSVVPILIRDYDVR
jgi:hypothetical protein